MISIFDRIKAEYPLVSVLVPIYGVEKYIERCIVSLMEQSYKNIEYVFVDDCTKDQSVAILEDVIKRYPTRLENTKIVRHTVNKGLSAARNSALHASTGKYIMNVDSDDYVDRDIILKCVEKALESKADIVKPGYISVYEDRDILSIPQKNENMILWRNKMILGQFPHSVWGCLIKRELYVDNNIQAIEGLHQGEDFAVMLRLAYFTKKYDVIEEALYYYLVRTNIYAFSEKKIKDTFQSWTVVNNFYKEKGDYHLYSKSLQKRLLSFEAWLIMSWQKSCPKNISFAKMICKTFPEINGLKGIAMRKKIVLFLFKNRYYKILSLYVNFSLFIQISLHRRGHDISI